MTTYPTPEEFMKLPSEEREALIYTKLLHLDPIVSDYDTFILFRKLGVGAVGILATVASIGGGIIWVAQHFRFK